MNTIPDCPNIDLLKLLLDKTDHNNIPNWTNDETISQIIE